MKKILTILILGILFTVTACSGNDSAELTSMPAAAPAAGAPMPDMAFQTAEPWDFALDEASFYGNFESGNWVEMPQVAESPAVSPNPTATANHQTPVTERRRIIRNANIDMETYDFDNAMNALRDIPLSVGGYIERSSMNSDAGRHGTARRFNITMRVPEAQFESVVRQIEQYATVTTSRQSAQDVTDQFYDMQARLDTLAIEEDRLLYLIEQATSISEILNLEQRLSSVRLQIGRYQSSLNTMIQQTTYSTIHVTLIELLEDEDAAPIAALTFGERMGGAFSSSVNGTIWALQEFIVLFAGAIIPLAIVGALAFAVYKVYRRYRSA